MGRPVESKRIVAEILAGQHDAMLGQINQSIVDRLPRSGLIGRWKMDHGVEVTEETLTLGEIVKIERLSGVAWSNFNPTATAFQAQALLTVVLQTRKGMSEADAIAEADNLTAIEAVAMFSSYVSDESPLDNPDPS